MSPPTSARKVPVQLVFLREEVIDVSSVGWLVLVFLLSLRVFKELMSGWLVEYI